MQFVPKGIIPAMVTPIDAAGRINESALRKLTEYLIVALTRVEKKSNGHSVLFGIRPISIGNGSSLNWAVRILPGMKKRVFLLSYPQST